MHSEKLKEKRIAALIKTQEEKKSTNTVNEVIHPFYYKVFINGY